MKQFIFLTIFFTIGLIYSCDKQDDLIVQNKFNTVVKFITPNENQKFLKGDTIHIQADITSDVSMHGYEILLYTSLKDTMIIAGKHTHGQSIHVDEFWVVDRDAAQTVEIDMVALIDHLGNNLSRKRKVSCN